MTFPDPLYQGWIRAGGDSRALTAADTAHLLVSGNRVASSRTIPGLTIENRQTPTGLAAAIRVATGMRLPQPVHLCIGKSGHSGRQEISLEISLEADASAQVIAHCVFPDAQRVRHVMNARIRVGPGAELRHSETHLHGPEGGVLVVPRARVDIAKGGRYFSTFTLTRGRVGRLAIDYRVEVGDNGLAELLARIFGHGRDRIRIREEIILAGHQARSLIKTRVALEDAAQAEISGTTEGRGAGSRGHVDCLEIVRDRASASAVPIVRVTHPQAKVTHEAAIGSVDQRQLETLMAHGLSDEEAVQLVVEGMLN